MPCYPYGFMNNNYYRAAPANSYVRVFNAAPNSPPIDVYLDNKIIVQNLNYKGFSNYLPFPAGEHNIKVYPAGQQTNPIINAPLSLPPGFSFNIAATGVYPNIILYVLPEPNSPNKLERACIRFIHLSPNTPAVDIRTPDGSKIFSNVKYEDYTTYACIPAGTYTFQIRPAGTNNVVVSMSNVQLLPKKYYSIYAVGLAGGSPPLQGFVVEEGPFTPK